MKPSAERAIHAELDRHAKSLSDIIIRHPEYRAHICYALLGSAIAFCDSFGIDVEAFVAELRRREPKPDVLVPPKKGAS